jgi:hypothetical protein
MKAPAECDLDGAPNPQQGANPMPKANLRPFKIGATPASAGPSSIYQPTPPYQTASWHALIIDARDVRRAP